MTEINRSMGWAEWTLIVVLSILWGGSFVFNAILVPELPRITIVALRVGIAAVALHLVLRVMSQRMPLARPLLTSFFVMGLLNNMIPFTLIVTGQAYIGSGLAAILNATTPLFTVVVAHFFTRDEKMTGGRLAGVLIGFVGVAFMIGIGELQGLRSNAPAQVAVLGAALSYACAGVYGRRFRVLGVPPVVTATGQVTASAIILVPLALLIERPSVLFSAPTEVWGALLGLGLLSTALAYIIYFRVLASAGASNALLVTFLIPVSAIFLGATFLHERLEAQHLVGMALIGLGLAAIDERPLRALRKTV